MEDHIRKLNIKIRNKETELNELFTKIQNLKKRHYAKKKLVSKKLGTVLGVIFGVDEDKDKN